jgi:hypothetical protein
VKALEKEIGVRLVVNNKGKLHLTAKGEQYFDMRMASTTFSSWAFARNGTTAAYHWQRR